MRFGIIDHNDDTGRPHARQIAERLELIEAYDRLGFYAYHLTEHHGTPLSVTPPASGSPATATSAGLRRLGKGSGEVLLDREPSVHAGDAELRVGRDRDRAARRAVVRARR
jgi:alkanesulfonate monooxygenase SsuD/methylene tetrahydromethanopterin reductase-like flavin-dependent oxidoreductase (luciferase family)